MDAVGQQRWAEAFPWLTETDRSSQLLQLLQSAELTYRSSALQLRALGRELQARKMDIFASNARLDLEQPKLARWLHAGSRGISEASDRHVKLERALASALTLLAADRGNIQVVDPADGALKIAVHCGFDAEFLDYFAVVADSGSACGRAAKTGRQAVISDVNADARFAPHRDIAASAKFRAVQSTPLTDRAGHLVGVLSTHYPRPHRPPAVNLRYMTRYAELIGAALAAG